jgi:hypothetical protein
MLLTTTLALSSTYRLLRPFLQFLLVPDLRVMEAAFGVVSTCSSTCFPEAELPQDNTSKAAGK